MMSIIRYNDLQHTHTSLQTSIDYGRGLSICSFRFKHNYLKIILVQITVQKQLDIRIPVVKSEKVIDKRMIFWWQFLYTSKTGKGIDQFTTIKVLMWICLQNFIFLFFCFKVELVCQVILFRNLCKYNEHKLPWTQDVLPLCVVKYFFLLFLLWR